MNMIKIATGLLIILISALGDAEAVQDELVARVQSVSADLVDPALPHIPLQEWINATLGSGAAIVWERSDCDLKPAPREPKEGYPICVVIRAGWKAERIGMKLHFLASSTRGNRVEPPQLQPQSFMSCVSSTKGFDEGHVFRSLEKLSGFPKAIQDLRDAKECK
jgi:hypothetical protein